MSPLTRSHSAHGTARYDGGNAIRVPPESLKQTQPKEAYAYWLAKRGDRRMPSPDDIDPTEILRLLPYLAIVEVLDETPVDYFYRIEGEAVQTVLGFRRMGRRLTELRAQLGPTHDWIHSWFGRVCAEGAPLAHASALTALNRGFYSVETLFLPLSRDGEKVNRILFCIGYLSRPEDKPLRSAMPLRP